MLDRTPTLERRATLGRLRSINPDMINHFTSQSQTCQHFLKSKCLMAQLDTTALQYLHRRAPFWYRWKEFLFIVFNIERNLWKVVQCHVEQRGLVLRHNLIMSRQDTVATWFVAYRYSKPRKPISINLLDSVMVRDTACWWASWRMYEAS